jgi:hypothetical protein
MRSFSKTTLFKSTLGVAAVGALAISLAACSTPAADDSAAPSDDTSESADAAPEPVVSLPDLSNGVDTQVTVDGAFVDAITSLGLTPGVVGTATFTDGVFSFPITGGNVDYYDPAEDYRPYVQGEINHDGSGLSLSNGTITVELTNFDIDPGESKLYGDVMANGEVVVEDAYLFNLHGGTLKPLQVEGDNGILEGTTVHISPDAAELLNTTFETDAIPDDFLVGVAKITVNTK